MAKETKTNTTPAFRAKLTRNTKGYTWEASTEATTLEEAFKGLLDLERKLRLHVAELESLEEEVDL